MEGEAFNAFSYVLRAVGESVVVPMLSAFADRGANGCGIVAVCSDSFGRFGMASRGGARTSKLMVEGAASCFTGDRSSVEVQASRFCVCRYGRIGTANMVMGFQFSIRRRSQGMSSSGGSLAVGRAFGSEA